ncbi:DUF1631 family protein [Marinobacter salicampi]|uniref:DUF1631 family protein n=1 Tax=Marinobacter salicampi TaxID=435907 RepID=UPI001F5ECC68|nr:DUF1631 family protein [Marinobacter salicampi]
MALEQADNKPKPMAEHDVKRSIDAILTGIRVPELPYPVGKVAPETQPDWRPLLLSCWTEQRDESVTHLLKSVSLTWTVTQVNAAYIADRIMDVFLRTSGLHPVLVQRVARLRFLLAWRMGEHGASAFEDCIRDWLDSLSHCRGWSDSGGRSSRALLDQLDAMVIAVRESFESSSLAPFQAFTVDWHREGETRQSRASQLHERLVATEQGAARQRKAEQSARALVGRALKGRRLPLPVIRFILDAWLPLLKEIAFKSGNASEDWRHTSKLLEWLVWAGDPALSDRDRDRLYQVGEQLSDKIMDVWLRIQGKAMAPEVLQGIQSVLVARLRGETPELEAAISPDRPFEFDSRWLTTQDPAPQRIGQLRGHWFVEGEGKNEQRRYFLDLLLDSNEVLWTNGFGVKLGLMPWPEVDLAFREDRLRLLPEQNQFGSVLLDTVQALARVLLSQRRQREKAAAEAKARADALRIAKEAADLKLQQEAAARAQEQERQQAQAEARRLEDEEATRQRLARARLAEAETLVANIKLGGWIAVENTQALPQSNADGTDKGPQRLKLAVRMNSSGKLIFVDRLGLNRTEYLADQLAQAVAKGEVRVLNQAAEFDDTLSRVVGRIRVGKS